MLAIGWMVGILALAGPSWQMQTSPFSEDQAALFIVLTAALEWPVIRTLDWRAAGFVIALLFIIRPAAIAIATIGTMSRANAGPMIQKAVDSIHSAWSPTRFERSTAMITATTIMANAPA